MDSKKVVVHGEKGALVFVQPNIGVFVFAKELPPYFADQDRAMCFSENLIRNSGQG